MSKLPDRQRILEEDFKEQKSWIGRLIYPINQFMENVTNILSNSLDFRSNFNCRIKEIDIAFDEFDVNNPYVLAHDLTSPCRTVQVMRFAWSSTNDPTIHPIDIATVPWVVFEEDGEYIRITKIIGLPSGSNRYYLKLLLLPE